MDVVKARAWKEFIVKNNVVPPAFDRTIKDDENPTPFCISLKNIEGIDSKSCGSKYRLRLSLFDIAYKYFFGKSWTSPVLNAKTSGGKAKLSYNQNVYFYTSVKDINVILVLEVISVENVDGKERMHSRGWSLLRLFASDDVIDLNSGRDSKTQRLDVFGGSPRALLHLEDPIERNPLLTVMSGCTILCSLATHISLLKIQHLLPENIIVGTENIVPGVVDKLNPESPIKDCLRKPQLLKSMRVFLDNVSVTLYPCIEKFEDQLIAQLNEDRLNRDNTVADGTSASITERRIQVGVHNGYCYVEKPEVTHLVPQELSQRRGTSLRKSSQRSLSHSSLPEKKNSNMGTTFVLRDRVPVNGMVYDPMFTIVFTLEYMISEPVKKSHQPGISMNKSQSFPVTIRWSAWSPFTKPPSPGEQISISFVGGPSPIPDKVFTYRVPKLDMESESAIKEMTGTMSFKFIDPKKDTMTDQDRAQAMLSVPSQYPQVGGYNTDTSGYTESVLHSAAAVVSGKPPRSSATTPSGSRQNLRSISGSLSNLPQVTPGSRAELHRHHNVSQPPAYERRAVPEMTPSPGMQYPGPTPSLPQTVQNSQPALYSVSSQYHPYQMSGSPVMMPPPSQQTTMTQYPNQMIPTVPHSAAYSSLRGYPIEIRHLAESGGQGDITVSSDLNELPFTPVHAPIMVLPSGSRSGTGMSRAAYARLYSANFPPILDRHKQDAEVVNPDDYMNFVMSREESDALQSNEIILQFLAFSRMSVMTPEGSTDKHSTVFFTFQFYKFPHITTERLLLGKPEQQLTADKSAQPCILRRLATDGTLKDGPAGYQIKYVVDPTHMKPGEGSLFVRHLSQQTLHIDVWDGDSLLLIGSCAVELKHLCRQGREAVQVTYELDVMATEVNEERGNSYTGDLSRGGSIRPVGVQTLLRGKLHLRLANVGHIVDPKFLPKTHKLRSISSTSPVIKPEKGDMQGSFLGGSLTSIQNTMDHRNKRTARANHLAMLNTELAALLHSHHAPDDNEQISKSNRKLARMQALREQEQKSTEMNVDENKAVRTLMSYKKQKADRARDLKIMEAYREQSKSEGIRNMLNQAITTEHTIHPSMGTTEFFEYQLTNPNNSELTIAIQTDNDDISVITDAREWRHFKQLFKVDTPLEEGMFNTEVTKRNPEVFLRPKEMVYIPMKYLSFEANHSCSPETPGSLEINAGMRNTNASTLTRSLSTKMLRVNFVSVADHKLISILALKVEPEPHVIDQTFRFHQPEQSFLKKSIRLPPFQNVIGGVSGVFDQSGYQQLVVRCSDQNVICESYRRPTGEPQDVFIKAAVGMSPQQKKFFVCIYSDMFLSKPVQIWQLYVHSLQRVDVSCVEGQTTRLSLILRGTQSSRLVKCYTSHSGQMQVSPNEAFMLAPGAVHELHVGVRPLISGTKFFYLNVVDVECHQLIRNWLVCVNCSPPVITKTFELQLPAGGGKGSNKRISFTNPYPHAKTFILTNNRNDLLQFKESRLEMQAKETRVIGLRFMPALHTGSADVLIFINDDDDKNEETFCVKVTYMSDSDED